MADDFDTNLIRIAGEFGDLARSEAQDPHGFWKMSERQLIDWLGAGNAQPGSVTYEKARMVLESKQRRAGQWSRESAERRSRLQEKLEASGPQPTNGKFFGLLALIVAVGALVVVVLPTTLARVVVVVIVLAVVAALFLPTVRRPVSGWLDRTFD